MSAISVGDAMEWCKHDFKNPKNKEAHKFLKNAATFEQMNT